MIELLLNAGADPNAALLEGETPLMTAARTGNADAVRLLLARGANVNAVEKWKQQTALMWAAHEGNAEVAKVLIEAPR
jgi:ankyrin repeat protein